MKTGPEQTIHNDIQLTKPKKITRKPRRASIETMLDAEPSGNNMVIKFKPKKILLKEKIIQSLRLSTLVKKSSEALIDHYEEIRRNSYFS